MINRQRPRVTLKVMFYALIDAIGMLVFGSGLMWLVRQETLFIPGFPTGTASALITVVAGIALMLWSAARILRELASVPEDRWRS
ncbi:MAG: hypothetical protein V5B32_12850 [Candidatus Accumulibacter sp. UW26]|jgi:uncharacterized membrane protein